MAFDTSESGRHRPAGGYPRALARLDPGTASAPGRLPLAYVLPLRADADTGGSGLTGYLRELSRWVDVIVVDGSPPERFARHAAAWRGLVRHVPPDPALRGRNPTALGVLTGVALAPHEHVVIADDDVRYDLAGLRAVHGLLDRVDLVRPQHHADPLPWHAWRDTGGTLLRRALGGDAPGTLAVRRSTFLAMGGYDPDVLAGSLELVRTVRAYGGATAAPAWLYVRRQPPTAGRPARPAYDEPARPGWLLAALAVLPAAAAALATRRPGLLLRAGAATVAVAELGRRRAGGARVFPAHTTLAAPLWLLERGVGAWLAVGRRLRGGAPAGAAGQAAHTTRALRRRLAERRPDDLVLWVETGAAPAPVRADRLPR
ncbi:glycosyltransferase family 2 protein [Micromonospora chaiyaphumensis]|uniref:Glycosyltransferase like family 2 n=1 Tax=Micromonospora chaiyaphumensis TaxID=307119 RepID=A0A1C4ZKM6_9ACTN|nr:glycosyltransferase family 2 protein [Micromonospora chaiyaphumensis]SCF33449.1 Glycosyltransferase like family 2 [Micromonospora chaiyaphumensis]